MRERSESLLRERLQAAAVLEEVTKRLEEMAGYLTESSTPAAVTLTTLRSLTTTPSCPRYES